MGNISVFLLENFVVLDGVGCVKESLSGEEIDNLV